MMRGDIASTQLTLSILQIRSKNYLCFVKRLIYILLLVAFSFPSMVSEAQTYKSRNWSGNIYLGASNMMSDLGGSNFVGSRGIFDWDAKATRPAFGAGIAVHMGGVSVATNFLVTHLAGNDAYSKQEFQVDRNLSVRTDWLKPICFWNIDPGAGTRDLIVFMFTVVLVRSTSNPKLNIKMSGINFENWAQKGSFWRMVRDLTMTFLSSSPMASVITSDWQKAPR